MEIPADFPGQPELARAGITSFGELDPLTDGELEEIRGIGPATVKRIRAARTLAPSGETVDVVVARASGWYFRGDHYRRGSEIPDVPRHTAESAAETSPPFIRILNESDG